MGWFLLIIHLVFLVLITRQVIILALALWTWQVSDIPYETTPISASKKLLTKLDIQPGQKVFDLGSGDGQVAIKLALFTPANVIAIEKNLILHLTAKLKWFFVNQPQGSLTLKRQDLFQTDLRKADYVYLYAVPATITKLLPKLISELKTETTLISWHFPVTHPKFKLIDKFSDRHTMYFYRKTS